MKYAIISDIHEDVVSLRKALKKIEKYQPDEIVCLGDITGFNIPAFNYFTTRNASECISLIRKNCSIIIAGNHDLFSCRKLPEHTSFFNYPDNWYSLDFYQRKRMAGDKIWLYEDNELSPLILEEEKEFLAHLPEFQISDTSIGKVLFSHSAFPDFSGSSTIFPSSASDLKNHFNFMNMHNVSLSFYGHGHVQGIELCFKRNYQFFSFGEYYLNGEKYAISCPAIAESKNRASGFLIFDSKAMSIKVIEMN